VLPPSFPGFRRYCPFKSPDLKKANELVAASGTRGTKVVVYTMPGYFERFGRYFVSVLRRLGYRASLTQRPLAIYFATISDTRNHVQIAFDNWIADYAAASDFINVLLSCRSFQPASSENGNRAGFCDRKIDSQIDRALSLQASSPGTVGPLWAQIDHDLVDQAPWVPMTNPKSIDFVSERVGGYQYNPQWGMLIDQLWVR
jgi:peptide/nickel transport system substrate-binding protein